MSDPEAELKPLFIQALNGDKPAYRRFLTTVTPYMRRFIRTRWPTLNDSEDRLQEILLAIHYQRHTYDVRLPLTAWLYGIAKYKLIDAHRRLNREQQRHQSLETLAEPLFAAEDHETLAAQRDVEVLLNQLPLSQRRVLMAVKLQGQTAIEAAQHLGISVAMVKVTVHRGLKNLTRLLRGSL